MAAKDSSTKADKLSRERDAAREREDSFFKLVSIIRGDLESTGISLRQQLDSIIPLLGPHAPTQAFLTLLFLGTEPYAEEKEELIEEYFQKTSVEMSGWLLVKLANLSGATEYFIRVIEKTPPEFYTSVLPDCMHFACCRQNLQLVTFLQDRFQVPLPKEALHLFCFEKEQEISVTRELVRKALEEECDFTYVWTFPWRQFTSAGTCDTFTPLQCAVVKNNQKMVDLYKELGADSTFTPPGTVSCADLITCPFYESIVV